jgi:hypothetical protein
LLQGSQEEDIEKVWSELKEFLTFQTDCEKAVKFVKWMKQKADLAFDSEPDFQFPIFRKGIYWAELGENIGSERAGRKAASKTKGQTVEKSSTRSP